MSRKSVSGTLKEEINNARSNLDILLQRINSSKETGLTLSDEEDENGLSSEHLSVREGSGDTSPRRKGQSQAGKKRKRAVTGNVLQPTGNAYIVKLFDRSVDLASYNESTPLYPMCRAWMRNSANDQYIEQPSAQQVPSGGETQFPEPYMTSEDEDLYKLRIPQPIKRSGKPLDIYAEPEDASALLLDHISHWKKVRESWRAAGKAYDARFSPSHSLIKQMYESASK